MNGLKVRIVRLEPLRIAAALGFGESPELQAAGKLMAWVESQGLLGEINSHRFFGFNNPSPSAGSPNYGYEQWMTLDRPAQADEEVEIKEFPGGQYAVARFEGIPNPEKWQQLVAWLEDSRYKFARHQWLEELLTPQFFLPGGEALTEDQLAFDLYLPIAE
jgi:DNA gyrase inhibitor GyrI